MDEASVSALSPHISAVHKTIFGLTSSNTEAEIAATIKEIAVCLGFDFYHYVGKFAPHNNDGPRQTLSDLPLSQNESCGDIDFTRFDPIFETVRARLTPTIWRPAYSSTTEDNSLRGLASRSEIGDGIICPIHAQNGDNAALGFFVRSDRGDATQTIAASVGDVSLAAAYVHESMARMATTAQQMPKVPLTRREIECLYWIAHHKSNWAIAKIIGISEHGVVYYVRRLMWKLDAQNRYDAVARANACGMLSNAGGFGR